MHNLEAQTEIIINLYVVNMSINEIHKRIYNYSIKLIELVRKGIQALKSTGGRFSTPQRGSSPNGRGEVLQTTEEGFGFNATDLCCESFGSRHSEN